MAGKSRHYLALGIIFLSCGFYAQLQTSKWYFGSQAGLDFATTPPTILTNGAMTTFEGCASIADAAGNLLFYTDGSTVYNNSHVAMSNGTGLLGFSSSSQSGIIVKQPGNSNIYFVFTQGSTGNGTRYSEIDMNLSSGQGSVTTKNTILQNPSSEKLTSVRHCNGTDIWVMSHDNNNNVFRAYLVSSSGVNSTAVTSTVGTVYAGADYIGILKFSPNGRKLAASLYGTTAAFEIYDFDNGTGIVSNALLLGGSMSVAYGVEFSPDGTKLYGGRFNNTALYQWDLCAGSNTAIAASQYTVVNSGSGKGQMQLAPNGKIYVARWTQSDLGIIQNPNVAGAGCNFVEVGQSIAPKSSQLGLPNFITSSVNPPQTPFTHTVNNSFGCQTASFTAPPIVTNFTTVSCAASGYSMVGMYWIFGDPASGSANTSTLTNPSHAYTNLGTYTAQLVINYSCGGGTDTIKQQVIINQPCITVTSTSITCASLGSATVLATGGIGPYSYTWMPGGQVNPVATGLSPGTYTLTVFDFGNNFTYTAMATFNSLIPLSGNLSNSSSVTCNGAATGTAAVTNISGGSGNQTYLWTNGVNTYTVPNPQNLTAGNYTYVVSDVLTGCVINAGFFISQPPALNLNITVSSPSVCAGTSISFTAANSGGVPGPGYTYTWSGGPATSTYAPFHGLSGVYIHSVSSRDANNCLITGTVAADIIANPVINVASTSICPLKTGTISALGATSYTWSDNSNGTNLSDNPLVTTTYSLVGAAAGCTSTATGSIVLKSVPVPTLSSNSPVCNGQTLSFYGSGGSNYQWTGPLGFNTLVQNPQFSPATPARTGVYNVTVTAANTCTNTASISVTVNPTPGLAATGSTVCINQPVNLSVNAPAAVSYTWTGPNGFTSTLQNPSITTPSVSSSGIYTVKISSAAGCTNSTVADVTVTALPVPLFSTDSPKCKGSMLTFNSSQSTGGVAYAWTGPNGFTYAFSNPLIVNVSVAASGVYTLYLSKGPCTASTTNTVVIYPLPLPVAANTGPACDTKSLGLSVTSSNVTYTWSGPGAYTSHLQNPHFNSIAAFQAGTYSVVVTDTNSCQNSASTPVIVLSNPVLLTQGAHVCYGAQAAISASGAATYTWSGPNGFSSNAAQSFIFSALNTSPLTYTVVGSALNTCTSIATALVATKVLPTPGASVTSKTCEGQPVYFDGIGGSLYEWSGPLNFYLARKSFSLMADNAGMGGTYTLKVTDTSGCSGFATAKLIINHVPAGSLAADKISGCIPFCSGFTFLNADQSPILSSSWQLGNATYTDAAFNYCFVSAGDYLLNGSFTNDNACTSRLSFVIKAYPLPQANFEYFPLEVLENEEVKFISTSNGDKLKNWDWHFRGDNQARKNTGNISYIFTEPGSYPVTMVVKNTWGCSDTIIKVVVVEEDFGFFVPNAFTPNGDDVNEVFVPVSRGVKGYSMAIFNRWGQKLFETSNPGSGWDGTFKGRPCTEDVYTWKIDARSSRDRQKNLTGTVLLYR